MPPRRKKTKFCAICNLTFDGYYPFLKHKNRVHPEKCTCETCGKVLDSRSSFYSHVRRHETDEYQCKICKFSTPNYSSLINHRIRHLDEVKFTCDYCNRDFPVKSYLVSHIARMHESATEVYYCSECHKTFVARYYWRRHQLFHKRCESLLSTSSQNSSNDGASTSEPALEEIPPPVVLKYPEPYIIVPQKCEEKKYKRKPIIDTQIQNDNSSASTSEPALEEIPPPVVLKYPEPYIIVPPKCEEKKYKRKPIIDTQIQNDNSSASTSEPALEENPPPVVLKYPEPYIIVPQKCEEKKYKRKPIIDTQIQNDNSSASTSEPALEEIPPPVVLKYPEPYIIVPQKCEEKKYKRKPSIDTQIQNDNSSASTSEPALEEIPPPVVLKYPEPYIIVPQKCEEKKYKRKPSIDTQIQNYNLKFINTFIEVGLDQNNAQLDKKQDVHDPEGGLKIAQTSGDAPQEVQSVQGYCKKCDIFFDDLTQYNKHHYSVHVKKKEITCGICGEVLNTLNTILTHSRKHKGSQFQCKLCDFKTLFYNALTTHRIIVHLKNVKFTCDHCKKDFKGKSNLSTHIRRIHLKQRIKESCPQCDKQFTFKTEMRRHLAISHPRRTKYSCDVCYRQYSHYNTYRQHVIKIHNAPLITTSQKSKALQNKNTTIITNMPKPLPTARFY